MTQPVDENVSVDAEDVVNELLASIAALHRENALLKVRVKNLLGAKPQVGS